MGAPTLAPGGNDRLAEILDRISDGFIAFDRDWRFVYLNRVAAEYLGRPASALGGRIFWEVFPASAGSEMAAAYRRAAAGTTPIEFEMVSSITGRWISQRIFPSVSGLTVYFRDISAEREAAETLREGEDRYRSLFDHSLTGIFLTSPAGETLAANPAACRMLRRSEEEICRLGRDLVAPEDPGLRTLLEQRGRLGTGRAEINMVRGDGTTIPIEVSSAVFTDRNGQPRTSLSLRDLTDGKRAEQALKLIVDAGNELSQSLERGEILRRLTGLLVPRVADVCLVDLCDGERLRREAIRHRDIDGQLVGQANTPWGREYAGARRVYESDAPDLVISVEGDEEFTELGVRSALRIPMRVAGKAIGVVSLFIVDGARAFSADDLATIEAVSDRAALALENARLY